MIISLVFFHLCKVLFSGFLQFKSNFVDAQNISKYREGAPLISCVNNCQRQRDKAYFVNWYGLGNNIAD